MIKLDTKQLNQTSDLGHLRIAHVTATFPPYQGGTGNVCYHNARELARHGHEVHVFTAAFDGAQKKEAMEGFTVHRLRPLIRVGNAPILPGLLTQLKGFDVIHLHYPFISGAEITAAAAFIFNIPLIITYHNDLVFSGSWKDKIFQIENLLGRHFVLNRANHIFFVSKGHAETCNQSVVYFRRKYDCSILPNGVDTELFCPSTDVTKLREAHGILPDAQVIGFVGGLDSAHHYKGLDILLSALATEQLTNAYLLVVGDGDIQKDYFRQAQQCKIQNRVFFCGVVANEKLPQYYQICDVVAMPSIIPESFGMVLIEALACAIPVVASNGPGVRTVVENGVDGLLVEPGNPIALAEAIRQIIDNKPKCQSMGSKGRFKVEKTYNWHLIGIQLENMYRELLVKRNY